MQTKPVLALAAAAAVAAAVGTAAPALAQPAPLGSAASKVIVVGLDGTMLETAAGIDTPTLHRLMAEGVTGHASILGHPTISGPSWSTILTGVWHEKHGVVDNDFTAPHFDRFPSVFARIEAQRPELRTASISTWDGIAKIAGSGPIDVLATTPSRVLPFATDAATVNSVVDEIRRGGPDFLFTQLDGVDAIGHIAGTDLPPYALAIEEVDRQLGRIVDAVDARARRRGSSGPSSSPLITGTSPPAGTVGRPYRRGGPSSSPAARASPSGCGTPR